MAAVAGHSLTDARRETREQYYNIDENISR
jgi:hypothetical protein